MAVGPGEQHPHLVASELMTSSQVAELLSMRRSTVEDYARRGLLPSIKLGRHRRFLRGDVYAALLALRGVATAPDGSVVVSGFAGDSMANASAKSLASPPRSR